MTALEKRVKVLETNRLDNLATIDKQQLEMVDMRKRLEAESEVVKKTKDDATAAVRAEIAELDERKNNVVVFGLGESEAADIEARQADDNVKVAEIFETIDANDCKFTVKHRAGKPTGDKAKPRPLIINFDSTPMKEKVMDKAKNLKGKEKFAKVFLSPDLTKRQRENEKAKEESLKKEAEEKNRQLTEEEKAEFFWKVVGPKGKRRVAKWWTQPKRRAQLGQTLGDLVPPMGSQVPEAQAQ